MNIYRGAYNDLKRWLAQHPGERFPFGWRTRYWRRIALEVLGGPRCSACDHRIAKEYVTARGVVGECHVEDNPMTWRFP